MLESLFRYYAFTPGLVLSPSGIFNHSWINRRVRCLLGSAALTRCWLTAPGCYIVAPLEFLDVATEPDILFPGPVCLATRFVIGGRLRVRVRANQCCALPLSL